MAFSFDQTQVVEELVEQKKKDHAKILDDFEAKQQTEVNRLQDEMKVVLCDASPGDHRVVWDRMGHPWSAWEAAPQALGPAIALGSEAILGRRLAVKFVKD